MELCWYRRAGRATSDERKAKGEDSEEQEEEEEHEDDRSLSVDVVVPTRLPCCMLIGGRLRRNSPRLGGLLVDHFFRPRQTEAFLFSARERHEEWE